jgi:hypothetical protein
MKCAWVIVSAVAAASSLLAGCRTSGMGRYDITVDLDRSLRSEDGEMASVEVHFIALPADRGRAFQAASMSDYWDPGRPPGRFPKRVLKLGEAEGTATLSRKDPVWRSWDRSGAEYLFILADLPGLHEDQPDVQDPRRLVLPLARNRWRSRKIDILIRWQGIEKLTPHR